MKFSVYFFFVLIFFFCKAFAQDEKSKTCEKILMELNLNQKEKCNLFPDVSSENLISILVCQKVDSSYFLLIQKKGFFSTRPLPKPEFLAAKEIADKCLPHLQVLKLQPARQYRKNVFWLSQGFAYYSGYLEFDHHFVRGFSQAMEFNYEKNKNLFSVRHVFGTTAEVHQTLNLVPPQAYYNEFDLLYGRILMKRNWNFSVSSGVSFNFGQTVDIKYPPDSFYYHPQSFNTIGIPVIARVDYRLINPFGVGCTLYGTLNNQLNNVGFMFTLLIGRISSQDLFP